MKIIKEKSILPIAAFATIIPIVLMIITYYGKGIYPGGPNTILVMDMQAQYMPFYAALRYLGQADNSIFFSMFGAMGGNFYGNFAYYLTSPLTWITVFFSLESLPDIIYIITLVKIGACGLTFSLYLAYVSKEKCYKLSILLLSCSYALMSYNIAYALNLMWLDGVMMLPLVLIGIERVLKEEKGYFLVFAVGFTLILNYYIAYMIAIFCVFYTVAKLIELKKWNFGIIAKLVSSALLGLGLSMPIVLPGIMAMSDGKMNEGEYEIKQWFRYSLGDVITQLFSGRYDTVYDDGLPFIFCGTCTLVLVIMYFIISKDRLICKLIYALILGFYIIAMCILPIDRFMHGMRETTCFEVRYGFVFCCLMLMLAYRAIGPLVVLLEKYRLVSLIRYTAVIFIVVELYMNASICVSGLMVESHYKTSQEYENILKHKRNLLELIDDESVYRVSDVCGYTHNDGAWLGYNGFGCFSSCYNLDMMNFLGDLGEDQIYHDLIDKRRTRLEESLLGAKYRLEYLSRDNDENTLGESGAYSVSVNPDALALGYMVDYKDEQGGWIPSKNAFENQNNFAKELSGVNKDTFIELIPDTYTELEEEGFAKHIKTEVTVTKDAPVWIYFEWADFSERSDKNVYITDPNSPYFNGGIQFIKMLVNGEDYGPFLDDHSSYMIYLGEYQAGEKIEIEAASQVYFGDVHIEYMDEDVYDEIIGCLSERQWNITEHGKGKFVGNIESKQEGNMLVTLPGIDGWKVKVDGEKVKPDSYKELFLLIPLNEGSHQVELEYTSPGWVGGLILGTISLVIVCVMFIGDKNMKKIARKVEQGV